MCAWKLKKIVSFEGTIECVTGISIRSGANELRIGGVDNEVIKNPLNEQPYIPGSSLKGKMRSQLERAFGKDAPCKCGNEDCPICTVFGAHKNTNPNCGPTRILVRDSFMTDAHLARLQELPLERRTGLESKTENIVNRSKGVADSPRTMERVPAGTEFTLSIQLQILQKVDEKGNATEKNKDKEEEKEKELIDFVKKGLSLVEESYLGNSGSRGYGQVKFHYQVTEKTIDVAGKKVEITAKEV